MKTEKVKLPSNSVLAKTVYDYSDSYKSIINNNQHNINSLMVGKAFFSSSPKWIEDLLNFRDRIVSFLGLKTSGETKNKEEILKDFKGEIGEQLGLFKVFGKTDNELILGEDDKHLNFRVSLFLGDTESLKKSLIISTTVKFNNWLGKLYFLFVKPFHKLIVPSMLKGIIKEIEKMSQVD